MKHLLDIISQQNLPARNLLEVGSRDSGDAEQFKAKYTDADIYIVEASEKLCDEIRDRMPIASVTNKALWSQSGKMQFNDASGMGTTAQRGMGSLLPRENSAGLIFNTVEVEAITGAEYLQARGLSHIDVLKIDVEGAAYEVLSGFGTCLRRARCLQVEAELTPVWKGQKLFSDVARLLIAQGFELAHFIEMNFPTIQCDSVWIRKD